MPFLEYTASLRENGGVWVQYNFEPYFLTQGSTYTCGMYVAGSGSAYLDVWTGSNSFPGTPVTLSSTPTPVHITFPMGNPGNTPNLEVRYNQPPVSVYFTDVTCAPGSSVTLASLAPPSSASRATSASSGTAPAASTQSVSSTTTSTQGTSTSTSLPKTGVPVTVPVGGAVALLCGWALIRKGKRA